MRERVEADVPSILKKDGVENNELFSSNQEVVNISSILVDAPDPSWSYRVIDSDSNSATLICQNPGEGNREHHHPDWNEWWYIIDGEWEWDIEGVKKVVKTGDIVFIEKGRKHKITAVGDKPAIRLAVSRSDVEHVYDV
jgi:quercetin dioxygenase-like cupin family protein|tara:strand:+ start:1911 stop:2327 length:417 start_codon:yes stop_codon:yes gene_type:complete